MNKGILPTFLGIGAARCGTTRLHECLKEHKEIFVPIDIWKEVHFFAREMNYIKGKPFYQSFFRSVSGEKIIGEITPNYLFSYQAPKRILEMLGPHVKLLISLRNPIDMLYSHYKHHYRVHGKESFKEFISLGDEYVQRGYYIDYIKHYLNYFKRENLYISIFEEFSADPIAGIREIYDFLGVKDINFIPSLILNKEKVHSSSALKPKNELIKFIIDARLIRKIKKFFPRRVVCFVNGALLGEIDPMTKEDRENLRKIYQPYNKELYEFLGRDLGW